MKDRLTQRLEKGRYIPLDHSKEQELWDKLGRLEDFEETLGIGLDILYKAEKQGTAWLRDGGRFFNLTVVDIDFKKKEIQFYAFSRKFSEYGLRWALTKKELEVSKQ